MFHQKFPQKKSDMMSRVGKSTFNGSETSCSDTIKTLTLLFKTQLVRLQICDIKLRLLLVLLSHSRSVAEPVKVISTEKTSETEQPTRVQTFNKRSVLT